MTPMAEESKTCGVCGAEQPVSVLCSTNQMTPSDLDLRPGEMARSTMPLWVQECGACGYCAADLSQASDSVERARAVCSACGCTAPWEGPIPERPPRNDLP